MQNRILIIAGSDSSGGAGVQRDIKTASDIGVFATTAITAITAQNPDAVKSVFPIPASMVKDQIDMVRAEKKVDVLKTGMLFDKDIIEIVFDFLQTNQDIPAIIDPVMVSSSGARLLSEDAIEILKKLFALAFVVTPNIPEAEAISGVKINNQADIEKAANKILNLGSRFVLIKGGHSAGDDSVDILFSQNYKKEFSLPRKTCQNSHGTGCCLATALASFYTLSGDLEGSVLKAKNYVYDNIL